MSKVHYHDEQFDGGMHAACGKLDVPVGSDRVVMEDDFENLPADRRCSACSRIYWPLGGAPDGP